MTEKEEINITDKLLHAKPIVDGKFWIIVEDSGTKVGTLHKKENNKFVLSSQLGEIQFNKKDDLTRQFGAGFFLTNDRVKVTSSEPNECYGFPTASRPYNPVYDVQKKLPLFTKSNQSKSSYCAGYYIIRFDKGWVRSFCPKYITLQRYPFKGPFKTEIEMKTVLANAKSD